jgi:hypothetical protein
MAFNIQIVKMGGELAMQRWIREGTLRVVGQEVNFFLVQLRLLILQHIITIMIRIQCQLQARPSQIE